MAKKTATSKKRNVRVDALGQLHVHSSFNNIIVSLTNNEGQVISWSSAGKMGFRGSKKTLLMLHKWQQKIVLKLHSSLVCVK